MKGKLDMFVMEIEEKGVPYLEIDASPAFGVVTATQIWNTFLTSFMHIHITGFTFQALKVEHKAQYFMDFMEKYRLSLGNFILYELVPQPQFRQFYL